MFQRSFASWSNDLEKTRSPVGMSSRVSPIVVHPDKDIYTSGTRDSIVPDDILIT